MPVELTIGGIALVPVVAAICQAAKSMGLPTKYVPVLNAILSVIAYALVVLVTQKPETLEVVNTLLMGLVVALAAAGFYSTVKYVGEQAKG